MKNVVPFANRVDPDEVAHYEPPHLHLHCLPHNLWFPWKSKLCHLCLKLNSLPFSKHLLEIHQFPRKYFGFFCLTSIFNILLLYQDSTFISAFSHCNTEYTQEIVTPPKSLPKSVRYKSPPVIHLLNFKVATKCSLNKGI